MLETHPFAAFCPPSAKYLMLGSFTAVKKDEAYDWYYCSKRNQFWPMIEEVYDVKLPSGKSKQELFAKFSIAITDIIYQCERKHGNSLDANLINFVYNTKAIEKILKENPIEKILFSSRFVEKEFKRKFKELIMKYSQIELVTLPSPSPRYAAMSRKEKVRRYKEIFPKFGQ